MGVDRKTYIGAYFEAETHIVQSAEKFSTCSNKSCQSHKSETHTKFCGQCGAEVKPRNRPKNSPAISHWEVSERLKEAIFCVSCWGVPDNVDGKVIHRYISNRQGVNAGFDIDSDSEPQAIEINRDKRDEQMAALENSHRADAALLRELYGADKVKTKWGILYMVW